MAETYSLKVDGLKMDQTLTVHLKANIFRTQIYLLWPSTFDMTVYLGLIQGNFYFWERFFEFMVFDPIIKLISVYP